MIHIAMIEDDTELAGVLIDYLKDFNIEVDNYEDPYIGLGALSLKDYDLLILDLTLPGMDGLDVCKEVVENAKIPIIISSARSSIVDKVTALKIGADDYLPKPYDPRELEVRIKAILRRYEKHTKQFKEDDEKHIFELNPQKKEIKKNGETVKLTAAEYMILAFFIKKRGYIIPREELLTQGSFENEEYNFDSSLAVIINRIRKKIEDDPKNPKYLQTIRGMGYKFSDQ